MEEMLEELRETLKDLKEKNEEIIGWSQKIRDGKIRIFVSKEKENLPKILKVKKGLFLIEYVKIGRVRIADGG